MKARLWQMVYVSRCKRALSVAELLNLLHLCNTRNAAASITGIMLYDGEEFIQALEGNQDAVRCTFERISQDRRHDQVVVAVDEPVLTRQFGGWAMKLHHVGFMPDGHDVAIQLAHDLADVTDLNVRALFISFMRRGVNRIVARARHHGLTADDKAMSVHRQLSMQKAQIALDQVKSFRRL